MSLPTRFVRRSPRKKNHSTLQPILYQGPANDPSLRNRNRQASLKPCPLIVHGPGLYQLYLDRSEGPVLSPVWIKLFAGEKRAHESRGPSMVQTGPRSLNSTRWLIPHLRIREKRKIAKNDKKSYVGRCIYCTR